MFLQFFSDSILPNVETILAALVVGVMAVALVITGLIVFRRGVANILDMIQGTDNRPEKGYQYEFIHKDGKREYQTFTRKDRYYYDKSRSNK